MKRHEKRMRYIERNSILLNAEQHKQQNDYDDVNEAVEEREKAYHCHSQLEKLSQSQCTALNMKYN